MKRYFLSVTVKQYDYYLAEITDQVIFPKLCKDFNETRISPIFKVKDSDFNSPKKITFFFINNPYVFISKLQYICPTVYDKVFVTHGLASIAIVDIEESELRTLKETFITDITVIETWIINESRKIDSINEFQTEQKEISSEELNTLKPLNISLPSELAVYFEEYYSLIGEIYRKASYFTPHVKKMFDSIMVDTSYSFHVLSYLSSKLSEEKMREAFKQYIFGERVVEDEDFEKMWKDFDSVKTCQKEGTSTLFTVVDEIVQVIAILKNVQRQLLSITFPILKSSYEEGKNSLLGIGALYNTLYLSYYQMWDTFKVLPVSHTINDRFIGGPCPNFLARQSQYEPWLLELKSKCSSQTAIFDKDHGVEKYQDPVLLPYFSNRLGFRVTKKSITAAIQSVSLNILPAWSLVTLTHEFLHSHVRIILGELYPDENDIDMLKDLKKYKQLDLFSYFKALFLQIINLKKSLGNETIKEENGVALFGAPIQSKDVIKDGLRTEYSLIEEIIVHVLDFYYFYDHDYDTYVKSIWASWLTLPFVVSRLNEYILRTVCALSIKFDGNRNKRFDKSIKVLQNNLKALLGLNIIPIEKISLVLHELENERLLFALKDEYNRIWAELVDTSVIYLVSENVKNILNVDENYVEQDDSPGSYEISLKDYEHKVVNKPSLYMIDLLKKFMMISIIYQRMN